MNKKVFEKTLAGRLVSFFVHVFCDDCAYGILHEGKLLQEITATELDKRCKKHLLLQVNDVAAASVLLESKLNTSNFSVMPDKSIHLYDYVENAGKVSALLSANNITIYQLAQSGDSLETYYTNLIGGCQND